MARIACILNPKARDGLSVKQWTLFEKSLLKAGFEIDLHHTEYIGHGMQIAANLCNSDYEIIVAVGGDGTVHSKVVAPSPQGFLSAAFFFANE